MDCSECFHRFPEVNAALLDCDGNYEDGEEKNVEILEAWPGLKVIFPSPPCRRITCHDGEENNAWYDYYTDHEGEAEDDFNTNHLEEVVEWIHRLLDKEVAAVGARHVFIGGSSQGCGVCLHAALSYPQALGGICGCMGHLLSSTKISEAWLRFHVPVFVYHGLADEIMPWTPNSWVKRCWDRLAGQSQNVHIVTTEGIDHGDGEDLWIRDFLARTLGSQP